MITLLTLPNFKGTHKQAAKALVLTLATDSFLFVVLPNLF